MANHIIEEHLNSNDFHKDLTTNGIKPKTLSSENGLTKVSVTETNTIEFQVNNASAGEVDSSGKFDIELKNHSNLPFFTDICLFDSDGKDISFVETIDILEDEVLTLRFNAFNTGFIDANITAFARRGNVLENISTFSGINEGLNSQTLTFTETDINALRAGSGDIRLNFIFDSSEYEGTCIKVGQSIPTEQTLTSGTLKIYSEQARNDLVTIADTIAYESIIFSTIYSGGTSNIELYETNVPVTFFLDVSGNNVDLSADASVTFDGYTSLKNGDYVLIYGHGTNFYSVLISNKSDRDIPTRIIRTSLDIPVSALPTTTTDNFITFTNGNSEAKTYILYLASVSLGTVTNAPVGLNSFKFQIDANKWSVISGVISGGTGFYSIYNQTDDVTEDSGVYRYDY